MPEHIFPDIDFVFADFVGHIMTNSLLVAPKRTIVAGRILEMHSGEPCPNLLLNGQAQ